MKKNVYSKLQIGSICYNRIHFKNQYKIFSPLIVNGCLVLTGFDFFFLSVLFAWCFACGLVSPLAFTVAVLLTSRGSFFNENQRFEKKIDYFCLKGCLWFINEIEISLKKSESRQRKRWSRIKTLCETSSYFVGFKNYLKFDFSVCLRGDFLLDFDPLFSRFCRDPAVIATLCHFVLLHSLTLK